MHLRTNRHAGTASLLGVKPSRLNIAKGSLLPARLIAAPQWRSEQTCFDEPTCCFSNLDVAFWTGPKIEMSSNTLPQQLFLQSRVESTDCMQLADACHSGRLKAASAARAYLHLVGKCRVFHLDACRLLLPNCILDSLQVQHLQAYP